MCVCCMCVCVICVCVVCARVCSMYVYVCYIQDPDGLSEEKAHGTISLKTYYNFFRAGANYVVLFIVLVLFFLAEVRKHSGTDTCT